MNPITKFCNWYLKRKIAQQQSTKKQKLTKDQQIVYKKMKDLYSFVQWLNTKGLKNRHQRKAFWRAVKDNKPILEETLAKIVINYSEKLKEAKNETK